MNEILFMLTRDRNTAGHVVRRAPGSTGALMPLERDPFTPNELRCLTGWLERSSCRGEVRADLRNVTTGLALRDRHLKDKLKLAKHPFAVAAIGPFSTDAGTSVMARLEFVGRSEPYQVDLHCTKSGDLVCKLTGLTLQLKRHGIVPPSFLGAQVGNEVRVLGTLIFGQPLPGRSLSSLEN